MVRERSFQALALPGSAMFIAYDALLDQTHSQERGGAPDYATTVVDGACSINIPLLTELRCIVSHSNMTVPNPLNIICFATFFKGGDFMRECQAHGSNVILITKEKMLDEDWPREVLAGL